MSVPLSQKVVLCNVTLGLLHYHYKITNTCVASCPRYSVMTYGPFHVGVASRLATAIYVAMVTPILYDNSSSLNDSNIKYESYWPYG